MKISTTDQMLPSHKGHIFVRRWSHQEPPTKAPIILLHDSLGSTEQWRDFPFELSQNTGRDVISYDRLGFGKSASQTEPLSHHFIQAEATGAFAVVCQAFEINHFVLLGHSVGGAMAFEIAAQYVSRCQAVISESAQAFVEAKTLAGIRTAKQQFADPKTFEKLAKWHADKTQWVLDAWTETWLHPDFQSWGLQNTLPKVKAPSLVLHGDLDQYGSSAFPQTLSNGVSGVSKMILLNDCGHVPHREQTKKVLGIIKDFLS